MMNEETRDTHCSKQLGGHFVYRVSHQSKDAWGAPGWSVVKPGHSWIHWFHCHCPRCNRNVSAGEWNARLPPRQEWVLWGETDPVFHYWQYTLLIHRFPLTVGPITSAVNIMRYLQPYEVPQSVQLPQDGSSVRLVVRRFGISPNVISRAWRRFRETGQCSRRAGGRLNNKDGLTRYGNSHVKDKTS